MQGAIIKRLKEGSLRRVVPFGTSTFGVPPYVVVRLEKDLDVVNIRVFVHFEQGAQQLYRPYVMGELSELLLNHRFTDSEGNVFEVYDTGRWDEASAVSDDNTLSMERIFYVPFRTN